MEKIGALAGKIPSQKSGQSKQVVAGTTSQGQRDKSG